MIFTIAVLCNSITYNSTKTIHYSAILELDYVSEMAEMVKLRSGRGDHDFELSRELPEFIWVLRDFQLALKDHGKTITPDEYLEDALKHAKGRNVYY